MKILTIVGARPQFIKAAAVSRVLRAAHHEVLLHTGQHYDEAMSAAFFRELSLPLPDIELHVGSGRHGVQTARMLEGIEQAIVDHRPDRVLVYGDTNSTLAGALAAAKLHVAVAHVEAGLRSFNRKMPEEINRVLVDQLADLLFCPSETAAENLRREGISGGIHVVGDVMAESVHQYAPSMENAAAVAGLRGLTAGQFFFATVHRAENTDDGERLRAIVEGFAAIGEPIVFAMHPRARHARAQSGLELPANVIAENPLSYMETLALVRAARAVLTDSGGLQKEAYWLGVPCLTLREETEWVETVEAGWNHLVGANPERIAAGARHVERPPIRRPLYGEGEAVGRICNVLAGRGAGAMV